MADFHAKAFDAGTLAKLKIFRGYAEEWLPVFIHHPGKRSTITIVDFFAGPGRDREGQPGSPILLLEVIRRYESEIQKRGVRIRLIFNDKDKKKSEKLIQEIEALAIPPELCQREVHNFDFEEAYARFLPNLRLGPNLLIFDQTGVRAVSNSNLRHLLDLPRTDLIFFIASDFIRRFGDTPEMSATVGLSKASILSRDHSDTHREVARQFRNLLGPKSRTFLHHFSIKKGRNIYGLIFASAHPRGMEKFLKVCWKYAPSNGEANFDIDRDDIDPVAPRIFEQYDIPKKLEDFQSALKSEIIKGKVSSDGEVYLRCLQEGMLPRHGKKILVKLIQEKRLRMAPGQRPRVSLDGYNQPRKLEVINNGPL